MEIDVAGFFFFGDVFFAKGFEVEFSGVLYHGFFCVMNFDGEHVFRHLVFFVGIEVEGA